MTKTITNPVILPPPSPNIGNNSTDLYKYLRSLWERDGKYKTKNTDLTGLIVSVPELNQLLGIKLDKTVQKQINDRPTASELGSMAWQNSNNVNISGGALTNTTISKSTIKIDVGSTTSEVYLGGALHVDSTDVTNTGGVESDLMVYTLPGNSLAHDGDFVEIRAYGVTANNANLKQVQFRVASVVALTTGMVILQYYLWEMHLTFVRESANFAHIICTLMGNGTVVSDTVNYLEVPINMSDDLEFKCTGSAMAANEVTQKGFIFKWFRGG